jgi:hypothetical protein
LVCHGSTRLPFVFRLQFTSVQVYVWITVLWGFCILGLTLDPLPLPHLGIFWV